MSWEQVDFCIYYIHYTFKEVPSQYMQAFVQLMTEYVERKPAKAMKVKSVRKHLAEVEAWYAEEKLRIENIRSKNEIR